MAENVGTSSTPAFPPALVHRLLSAQLQHFRSLLLLLLIAPTPLSAKQQNNGDPAAFAFKGVQQINCVLVTLIACRNARAWLCVPHYWSRRTPCVPALIRVNASADDGPLQTCNAG